MSLARSSRIWGILSSSSSLSSLRSHYKVCCVVSSIQYSTVRKRRAGKKWWALMCRPWQKECFILLLRRSLDRLGSLGSPFFCSLGMFFQKYYEARCSNEARWVWVVEKSSQLQSWRQSVAQMPRKARVVEEEESSRDMMVDSEPTRAAMACSILPLTTETLPACRGSGGGGVVVACEEEKSPQSLIFTGFLFYFITSKTNEVTNGRQFAWAYLDLSYSIKIY